MSIKLGSVPRWVRGPVTMDRQLLHEVAEALHWIAQSGLDIRNEDNKMIFETIKYLAEECSKLEERP